jgi:hypothetical protein
VSFSVKTDYWTRTPASFTSKLLIVSMLARRRSISACV